jgi:hypothetical protein
MYQNKNDITEGIDEVIWQSIEKAIDSNNLETFKTLNDFVVDVLLLSSRNKSLEHYSRYINFFSSYYYNSYLKKKDSITYNKFYRYVTTNSARHLNEFISYIVPYNEKDIEQANEENLSISNAFLYKTYCTFSRMIYMMIRNSDTELFDYVINEYDRIDPLNKYRFYNLKFEIRTNSSRLSPVELEKSKRLYGCVKYFDEYKRHGILGLRYWAIYLYKLKLNDLESTRKFLDGLIMKVDSQEIVSDLLYLRHSPNYNYFEWSSWDYKERLSGKIYKPPNVNDWLTFGFVVDLLKEKEIPLYINDLKRLELDEIQINDIPFFADKVRENIAIIKNDTEFWKSILGYDNELDFERRADKINNYFEDLRNETITSKERSIAEEPLDLDKIKDFKNYIGEVWKQNLAIGALFLSRGNVEKSSEVINFIGQEIFPNNLKRIFLKSNSDNIFNVGDVSGIIARWIDDAFFSSVFVEEIDPIVNENIKKVIDDSINWLESKGQKPNVIILSSFDGHSDVLVFDEDFKWKQQLDHEAKNKYLLGTYKDINIYTSYSELISNKIIVADFENAFKMRFATADQWFDNMLKVDVEMITDIEAERIYQSNPKRWMRGNKNVELSKEESIVLIKNSVHLVIGSFNEFDIINKDAFIIGTTQSSIQTDLSKV